MRAIGIALGTVLLVSTAWAEHSAVASRPAPTTTPTSAPAETPTTQPTTAPTVTVDRPRPLAEEKVADAYAAVLDGKHALAKKLLKDLYADHETDPFFLLAMGVNHLMLGPSYDGPGRRSLERSLVYFERMKVKNVSDVQAILGLARQRNGDLPEALEALVAAQAARPRERTVLFALAISSAMREDYERAYEEFSELAETEDEVGKLSRVHANQIAAWRVQVLPLRTKRRAELNRATDAAKTLEAQLRKAKDTGREASKDRIRLRKDYDDQYEAIDEAHETELAEIEEDYRDDLPSPALRRRNPERYAELVADAQDTRRIRRNAAERRRDEKRHDLDTRFRPLVREVDDRIDTAIDAVEDLKKRIDGQTKQVNVARRRWQKVADLQPFNAEAAARPAMLLLAQRLLGR